MANQFRSNESKRSSLRVRTGMRAGTNGYSPAPNSYYSEPDVYWWSCQACNGERVDPSSLKNAHCEVCNYS
jgi:hypothetical protein